MPQFLIQPSEIDTETTVFTKSDIEAVNPHRYEMMLLDAVVAFDPENELIIGYKDMTSSDFWVRGHIPERPLFPGVLMIECAAQLCSFYYNKTVEGTEDRFLGFAGVDDVKFRGQVLPGDRFIVVAKPVEIKSRRAIFAAQGIVGDKLVFEGTIVGMPI